MKKLIFLILAIGLLFVACDRYSHNFTTEPDNENTPQKVFDGFKNILSRLNQANIDSLMNYYSEGYLNNGKSKEDMENFYNGLLDYAFDIVDIDLVKLQDLNITFKINLIGDSDTLFSSTIEDVFIKTGNDYKFYGNQQGGQITQKQKVMVILFTGTRCQNCPYAESALEELKSEMGNKFSYAEFHIYPGDPLQIPICSELLSYYNLSGVPDAIFQGQLIYGHFGNETTDNYRNFINQFTDLDAMATLDSLSYTINQTNLSGRIKVSFVNDDLTDLHLIAVVVEKISDVLNYVHDNCRQVVLAYSATPINTQSGYKDFVISSLPETLPDDAQIIVWLQTLQETYDPETCKVYNVIEEDISR